jgi:predicted dehydrogenase
VDAFYSLPDWLVDSATPWSWRNAEAVADSGALWDLCAHSLDLVQFIPGDSIARVSGHLRTFVNDRPVANDTDDAADGGTGTRTETPQVTVGGAYAAEVEFEGGAVGVFETVPVTDPDDPYVDRWWPPGHTVGWEHTLVHESYEFRRSVSVGTECSPEFEDGRSVQRPLDTVERSDDRGGWIPVQEGNDDLHPRAESATR